MGMVIYNNLTAMSVLNENNRNTKGLGKALKKAASGMKINSAGDDASGYGISESMRVKLRALDQDSCNVKNGASMLRLAGGAVQEQINLLKTVKQKVIDASNDTNTSEDRATIQKEIDQCYAQMADIVYDTEFNGKKLLVGNAVAEVVSSWEVLDYAVLAEDSEITGLLTDATETTLDGEQGAFATFGKATDTPPYDGYKVIEESPSTWAEASSANTNGDYLVGGTKGTCNTLDIDLSSYTDVAQLSDTSFSITYPSTYYSNTKTFVLTQDATKKYKTGEKIDISGCQTVEDVAQAIKTAVSNTLSSQVDIAVSGTKITLTTKSDGEDTNTSYNAQGVGLAGGTVTDSGRKSAPGTGLTLGALTGGTDQVTHTETTQEKDPDDPDRTITVTHTVVDKPATAAKISISGIDSVTAGTGITLKTSYASYLVFQDGADGLTKDSANGYYTVGKEYQGSFTLGNLKATMSGSTMTFQSIFAGSYYNDYYSISDGVPEQQAVTTTYAATSSLGGVTNNKTGADGNTAHWDLDLSAYNITDAAEADNLISKYLGRAFTASSGYQYEFIDTGTTDAMDGLYKITSRTVDLNEVRSQVTGGKTVAEAFATVLSDAIDHTELLKDVDGSIMGISFLASEAGEAGNSLSVSAAVGELRHYSIDWQSWVNSQQITNIPEALHEKGFRFYCPTDSQQWVNVRFVNGLTDVDSDRPASGNESLDIKTVTIDVSGANSVESLVKKIDSDLGDYLENTYRHNLLLASDPTTGITTIYDKRRKTVRNDSGYDNQEKGAKIGTGIMDNIVKSTRNVYVDDLVIQHTDKANMNIHVRIPQTSLDQIFGYKEGTHSITEYNVLTEEMRTKLLGQPPEKGILDTGMEYLLDAQTIIGAQINHMEFADDNLTVQRENTTSAESVIRDADMAKAMMDYAKYNILSQAAQSMLAQANQNPSTVMSLLQ